MIKIDVTISGPRGCGKTFFLKNVRSVIRMIWRDVKFTKEEAFGEQVPTERLTVEIKTPDNPYLENLKYDPNSSAPTSD